MSEATTPTPVPEPSARPRPFSGRFGVAAGCAALSLALSFGIGGAAWAQSLGAGSGQFNSGWGGGSNALNQAINVSTRDANNNQVIVNGLIQTPSGSIFSNTQGFNQSSTSGGVGASGLATAIGNSLNVVVEGSWNRVVVDSTQINNGDVSANASLNGQIKLDGP